MANFLSKMISGDFGGAADSFVEDAVDIGTFGATKYLRNKKEEELDKAERDRQANISRAQQGLEKGFQFGEQLSGASRSEIGEGQRNVRSELQRLIEGDSEAANRLISSREQDIRAAKAAGGPKGQLGSSLEREIERQTSRDAAEIRAKEKQAAISGLASLWGDAAGDVAKLGGQIAAIETTAGQPLSPQPSNLLTLLGLA